MINDPRKFIREWFAKKKITVDERGKFTNTKNQLDSEIKNTLYLDYLEQHQQFVILTEKKIPAIKHEVIKMAIEEWISYEVQERHKELMEKLKFTGTENLEPLRDFVKALTGTLDEKVLAVLAHWVWGVKRKLNNLDMAYHIMPIIVGKQGGGKSEAVKKLCSPLMHLTMDTKLKEVLDVEKFGFAMGRNFIARLDEMSGAKKADMDELKRQISATWNDTREYHTQSVVKVKQNVSFIGTANRGVAEILFDVTGMRRFYQIDALDELDYKNTVNKIDYLALYCGINETREIGYLEPLQKEISKEQDKLVGQDEVGAFLEYFNISGTTDNKKEIKADDLYERFATWAKDNGIYNAINAMVFGRKLGSRNIKSKQRKVGGKVIRFYMINEDSSAHIKSFTSIDSPLTKKSLDDI